MRHFSRQRFFFSLIFRTKQQDLDYKAKGSVAGPVKHSQLFKALYSILRFYHLFLQTLFSIFQAFHFYLRSTSCPWAFPLENRKPDVRLVKYRKLCFFKSHYQAHPSLRKMYYCPRRDFAQRAKTRGGILVARAYYRNILTVEIYSHHHQGLYSL